MRSNRALDAEAVGRLVQQLWSAVGLDGELIFPGDRRKENMKPKDAIELLKGMQNPLQDYAEMVGAPTWSYGCRYVYPDPEDYAIEEAIIALEEKEKRKWVLVDERLPDKPGDYWVTMRHLDGSITTEKMFWSPDWPHEDAWNEVVVAWQPYYCPEPFITQN